MSNRSNWKIGYHAAGVGNYNGFDTWRQSLANADQPRVWQQTDANGELQTLQQELKPKDVLIFRRTGDLENIPYTGNPEEFARNRITQLLNLWPTALDPKIVWMCSINEPSKEVSDMEWLARYELACATEMLAAGRRYLAFGWSTGTPEPEWWENQWSIQLLQLCAANPNLLGIRLHEYSLNDDIRHLYPHLVGRFKNLHNVCDEHGLDYPTLIIGECGWNYNSVPLSESQFSEQLSWLQDVYAPYPNIKGAALWTLGGPGWGSAVDDLIRLMPVLIDQAVNYVGPELPDPTPPDPDPVDPPVNYVVVVNLLPQDATLAEKSTVLESVHESKQTILQSADDAVRLVKPGLPGSKVKVWWENRWQDDIVSWLYDKGVSIVESHGLSYIDLPPLSQCDSRWAAKKLGVGTSNATICSFGCLLVVYTMMGKLWGITTRNPDLENDYYISKDAFSNQFLKSMAMSIAYPQVKNEGWLTRSSNLMHLKTQEYLSRQIPVPARVDFDPATPQWEQHWVLLTGWDPEKGDYIMNDPWGGRKGVYVSDYYGIPGSDILECLYYYLDDSPPPPPPPPQEYTGPVLGSFISGVDQPASDWNWPSGKSVYDKTGLIPKFHTSGVSHTWFNAYKSGVFNPVRVVIDRGFTNKDPGAIWNEMIGEVSKYWNLGARDFIFLNEPNTTHESFGKLWDTPEQFGDTFNKICAMAKNTYPGIRIWFPGMSPGFGVQFEFIDKSRTTGSFQHIYGVTEHVYTGITNNAQAACDEMFNEVLLFRSKYTMTRPLILGEFSVNRPATAAYKADVYKRFFNKLKVTPGIWGAYSFTSTWYPNADENQEGWLEHGIDNAYMSL